MESKRLTTQGPKRRRRTRRDLPSGQVRRWDKRPGNYTPNIERALKLAPPIEDPETTYGGW